MQSSPIALTVLALLHYRPSHPYGIQRLLKQWGKDRVVNVAQRTNLYRTIDRLLAAKLIGIRETSRDQQYPERTIYEITEAGRRTAREWLVEAVAKPRQEFPEFPAALSNLLLLTPAEMADVLQKRADVLTGSLEETERELKASSDQGIPRVATLEDEYLRAVTRAELDWVRSIVDDLRSGRLTWSASELTAFANAQEPPAQPGE